MRKLFMTIAGAIALLVGSVNMMPAAEAQPYGYGRRMPPPPAYRPPPPRGYYARPHRPRCWTQSVRVWNGYRHVIRPQRVCR